MKVIVAPEEVISETATLEIVGAVTSAALEPVEEVVKVEILLVVVLSLASVLATLK